MRVVVNEYEPKNVIKFVRESTGLTQEQLGIKLGKNKNTIQSYELGRIKMSLDDFINLCKDFDIKITIEEKSYSKQ